MFRITFAVFLKFLDDANDKDDKEEYIRKCWDLLTEYMHVDSILSPEW